ncbi:MAG: hypothetical protein CMJ58_23800 [Planctomycetaceae bacterium]|nr:hypothetical protein [Planctomycetaceae bacterium]
MASRPDISVVVTTYQRPGHLLRCLHSLARQEGVAGRMEVLVVDDGSQDETPAVVAEFAAAAPFYVGFHTHPHDGYCVSKARNAGIRMARADYVLFTDGDCVFPRGHVARHLKVARPGVVRAGDTVRLDEATSAAIGLDEVDSGQFVDMARDAADWRRIGKHRRRAPWYDLLRHPTRPKLVGCDFAAWRWQLEAVNGFDEGFSNWGCEDDDLGMRLRRAGARVKSMLRHSVGYHIWHQPHHSTPERWQAGSNVDYHVRPVKLTRCLAGAIRRDIADVAMTVTPGSAGQTLVATALAGLLPAGDVPEVELLLGPRGRFQHSQACRLLIANPEDRVPRSLARQADAVLRCDAGDCEAILAELDAALNPAPVDETGRLAA